MAKKILLVDDDKDILMVLSFALQDAGYDVSAAPSGQEAIEKVRQCAVAGGTPFPVAVIDIMMPEMDGLELLRLIKSESPDTMAVMLTAHLSAEAAIRALNEGAFAYLTKPVNIAEINLVASNAYEKYSLVMENRRLMAELAIAKNYSDTIVRNMMYTVIATDNNGFIRKINKATEDMLGYTDAELAGAPLETIFAPAFKAASWQDMIKQGKVKDFPMMFLSRAGREVKVFFTGTILKDEDGQIIGFLGTVRK
ncbi:MAG: hypothetical protein A2314_07795 [Elusimicrobia bacterium RIFOXYB2_FULL_50_12]|nr:MAG: hypothetical protein A2314_07795 [Elusimicrobia bacterium RIFOXYB2_FULL_50_12]